MLTYQKLSSEQVADIYHQHMQQDFPPAEVKPLSVLHQLMEQGLYEPYGWFDENGNLNVNMNSRLEYECLVEPSLKDAKAFDRFQFVRKGFFCVDYKDSTADHIVFNRIVSMKSSFKIAK